MAGWLIALAVLLLVLATAGGTLRRFDLSAIPAYILLGVATRTTLVEPEIVHFVQAIGVALLLFFVGLEFSILRLRREARRLTTAGFIDLLVNLPVGVAAGLLLGWGLFASFLLGVALYISSSAIVAGNITALRRAAFPGTEVALGVLVMEDLIIAVLLAGIALVAPVPGPGLALTAAGIVVLVLVLTVLADPLCRLLSRTLGRLEDEPFLLAMSGFLLLFAGGALAAGLSEAVGAFAAGLLIGNSALARRTEELLSPLQGLFSALFFFAFGLTIDAATLPPVAVAALGISGLAVVSKLVGSWWIGRRVGLSLAARINLGLTLTPRGEFSVVVAAYGASAGHPDFAAVVGAVVVILSVVGTLLTQAGPALGTRVTRWLSEDSETEEEATHAALPRG